MAEQWVINNAASLAGFIKSATDIYAEHKYVTYGAPRIGRDRSLDSNALLHVWLTEYAAHLLDKNKKSVTKGEIAGIKRVAKKRFTATYPQHASWMVHVITDPFSKGQKKDYTSSKDWKKGEMYVFLNWLQMHAANDGLILESKGEHAKKQRAENE